MHLEIEVMDLRQRIEVLEAQVRSLQFAVPRGIPHDPPRTTSAPPKGEP